VRYATIQNGLVQGSDEMLGNPLYMMAISLLLKGTEACVTRKQVISPPVAETPAPTPEAPVKVVEKETPKIEKPKVEETPIVIRKKWKDKIKDMFVTNLFDEEEDDNNKINKI
jgi:hypothetical protein